MTDVSLLKFHHKGIVLIGVSLIPWRGTLNRRECYFIQSKSSHYIVPSSYYLSIKSLRAISQYKVSLELFNYLISSFNVTLTFPKALKP